MQLLTVRIVLTTQQRNAAEVLRACRPLVIPGTRVIINREKAVQWHADVMRRMRDLNVNDAEAVKLFCDAAGVAG